MLSRLSYAGPADYRRQTKFGARYYFHKRVSRGLLLGGSGGDLPGTATAAGGTHPTGMHSCLKYFFANGLKNLNVSFLQMT